MTDAAHDSIAETRARMVADAMADIQGIEERDGVTRESLEKIRDRLIALAAEKNRLLAVGHELRLSSLWQGVKQQINQGDRGHETAGNGPTNGPLRG